MQNFHRRDVHILAVPIAATLGGTTEIDMSKLTGGGFGVPAGSSITSLTLYGTAALGGTYYALQDGAGNALAMTVAAGKGYPLPAGAFGSRGLKLVGNVAGIVDLALKG